MAPSKRSELSLRVATAAWIIYFLYNVHTTLAAPLPQADASAAAAEGSSSSTNTSLIDPFSTPDYLAPSKFTWEQGVYGVLFILFGAVEVLHGYKYIRFTMLLAGFLVWSSTAVMIMIIVNSNTGAFHSSGIYFLVWVSVGIVGALVSFYLWHVGIILTGAYGSFVLVAVLFTAGNVTNYIFRYVVLVICLILGGYLTYRYERMAVILATSVGGAYCVMFGLDMFVQTGFRTTFHVMLSQSTDAFYPIAGTWVMIAFVPVIAVFGIVWELKHHEEPVTGWLLGSGAKPLPPLPGEKPRRCCGFAMSRSAKAVKKAINAEAEATAAAGSSSESTLVPPPSSPPPPANKSSWKDCLKGRSKPDMTTKDTSVTPPAPTEMETTDASTTTAASPLIDEKKLEDSTAVVVAEEKKSKGETPWSEGGQSSSFPLPVERTYLSAGHETIGHTGMHKVVIHREVKEVSVDVDERW
ncbi:hypothetical protein BG015_005727 [Linnemannia schmuckeri]|uniref:Transmembrane protein 198 n=1 Tax=Linnemannia schmuckeri TaxID=64567 RepID=A0A9P5S0P2_9FUNG|nr:hypothetical protein BG015_005727 [Linnemannia schmuckeri]